MKRTDCLLLLSLGLLAACEREPVGAQAVAPAPALQSESPTPPLAPVPAAAPAPSVVEAAQQARPSAIKTTPVAKPGAQPSVAAAKPEPQVALDLSLPEALLEPSPAQVSGADLVPLLPPLFVDKGGQGSPVQLSGRLLSNERTDDYWESIEGAELQFEFKQ